MADCGCQFRTCQSRHVQSCILNLCVMWLLGGLYSPFNCPPSLNRRYSDVDDPTVDLEQRILRMIQEFAKRLSKLMADWLRVGCPCGQWMVSSHDSWRVDVGRYCQGNFNSDNCLIASSLATQQPCELNGSLDTRSPTCSESSKGVLLKFCLSKVETTLKTYFTGISWFVMIWLWFHVQTFRISVGGSHHGRTLGTALPPVAEVQHVVLRAEDYGPFGFMEKCPRICRESLWVVLSRLCEVSAFDDLMVPGMTRFGICGLVEARLIRKRIWTASTWKCEILPRCLSKSLQYSSDLFSFLPVERLESQVNILPSWTSPRTECWWLNSCCSTDRHCSLILISHVTRPRKRTLWVL